MLIINVKRYIKNPVLMAMTLIYFVAMGYLCVTTRCGEPVDPFIVVMRLEQISFLFFLFVAFEFFSETKRSHTEEMICVTSVGLHETKWSGIIPFIFMDSIVCLLFFCFEKVSLARMGIYEKEYLLFLFQSLVIFQFLTFMFAVILGVVVSYIDSRMKGYGILLFIYFIFSKQVVNAIEEFAFGREWIHRVSILFNLFCSDFETVTDYYYIFSAEAVNVQRIMFWIFFAVTILFLIIGRKRSKMIACIPGAAMLICLYLFFLPTSAVSQDTSISGQDAWSYDDTYYKVVVPCMDLSRYQDADFKVLKYRAEFTVRRELQADVAVHIDEKNKKAYEFTLYHGYQISSVTTEDGTELAFWQDGDYVTVKNSSENQSGVFVFHYKGYCKRCYSTKQGVYLPAYLEYYPVPGRRQVYVRQNGYWGNSVESLGYEVDFDVVLNTECKIYSNLQVSGEKHITGRSDGLTLLCSSFAREVMIGNNRIIYPYLDLLSISPDRNLEEINMFFDKYAGEENSLEGKTIIIPPSINGTPYYFGKDHLIGSFETLEIEYERYIETGELYNYISDEEIQKQLEEFEE